MKTRGGQVVTELRALRIYVDEQLLVTPWLTTEILEPGLVVAAAVTGRFLRARYFRLWPTLPSAPALCTPALRGRLLVFG
jgi:hypothetical protein